MTEPSSQEPKEEPESESLDLSDLQSFSFGTQWTDAGKQAKGGDRRGSNRGPGHGKRPDRRGPGGGGPGRDRRPPKRSFSSDRGPRDERGQGGGGDRRFQNSDRRPRGEGGERRGRFHDERPYESPVFDVGFYPDDSGFSTIIKALRTNHITYELFHVAKIFLEKSDRFVASVTRKAAKGEKPERVFVSVPDGMPFETEEEAIQHAVTNYAEQLFETEEVEVEAPTGNFPFVNRCGMTKKLLGPPNYHRYEEFVNLHHKTQLAHVPFEKFKRSIEQVREEEAVNEWLESMKKATKYTSKPAEGEEPQTFDSLSDAIGYLRTHHRDQIVKPVNYARVSGVVLDKFANTEASRAVAGELARQRRFPLETANAIRGRLRREKFSIYKKGAKGVTLICATKRNFRKPGQVMSESLDRLISFLEANQNIKAKELPPQFEAWLKETFPDVVHDEKKLFQDLHWLIADGYVSHFSDDSLFVQPPLDNEPKRKESIQSVDAKKASPSEAKAKEGDVASESPREKNEADSKPDSNPEGTVAAEASETPDESVSPAEELSKAKAEEKSEVAKPAVTEASDAPEASAGKVESEPIVKAPEKDAIKAEPKPDENASEPPEGEPQAKEESETTVSEEPSPAEKAEEDPQAEKATT